MAFRSFFFRALIAAALLPTQALAQDTKTDPKVMKAQLEQYLKAHPNLPRKLEPRRDGRIDIPDRVLKTIEYEFEKRYAMSGHGQLYDGGGNRTKMSLEDGLKMQEQIIEVLQGPERRYLKENEKAQSLIKELTAMRRGVRDQRRLAVINHAIIRGYLVMMPRERGGRFRWRSRAVLDISQITAVQVTTLLPGILDLLAQLENRAPNAAAYRQQCDAADVIAPQSFAVNDNIWTHQGDLATNLLSPGQLAKVYTFASANHRGGCVALPRGGATPFAGFICQSATTGNACFWDNIDPATGARIPWATGTMRLDEIENATTLDENCTDCHQGNNVFNVAPDDPTWCRLLRGATSPDCAVMDGPHAANFTLQVDAGVNPVVVPGVNPPLSHPSYRPLTGTPARPAWVNNPTPSCGASCHLSPGISPTPAELSMPPACLFDCN